MFEYLTLNSKFILSIISKHLSNKTNILFRLLN